MEDLRYPALSRSYLSLRSPALSEHLPNDDFDSNNFLFEAKTRRGLWRCSKWKNGTPSQPLTRPRSRRHRTRSLNAHIQDARNNSRDESTSCATCCGTRERSHSNANYAGKPFLAATPCNGTCRCMADKVQLCLVWRRPPALRKHADRVPSQSNAAMGTARASGAGRKVCFACASTEEFVQN